jgi:hypothetical protein
MKEFLRRWRCRLTCWHPDDFGIEYAADGIFVTTTLYCAEHMCDLHKLTRTIGQARHQQEILGQAIHRARNRMYQEQPREDT